MESIRRFLFGIRWLFMKPKRRYVYLWNRAHPDDRF